MKSSAVESASVRLPVRHDLTLACMFSLFIAFLMIVAPAVGLRYRTTIYPTGELVLSFVPSDAFNLIAGLALLPVSMWLARRGRLIGLFNAVLGEECRFRGALLPTMAGVFGNWSWVANGMLCGLYHVHQRWGSPELWSAAPSSTHSHLGAFAAP
jgi:CAAX protease family protein